MTFEIALENFLKSKSSITDIVGPRIFNRRMPREPYENVYPCIVYFKISSNENDIVRNYEERLVQFSCFGTSPADTIGLEIALRTVLSKYQGIWTDDTNSYKIIISLFHDSRDLYDNDTDLHHNAVDFLIKFTEV